LLFAHNHHLLRVLSGAGLIDDGVAQREQQKAGVIKIFGAEISEIPAGPQRFDFVSKVFGSQPIFASP
jgi:hypothetical protein